MSDDRKADFESLMISRSNELMVIKDRIYYLIKDIHKGEEGRYKEAILSKIISSSLPDRYGIGTGFAICDDDEATSQIDIIIYDKHKKENNPTFLEQGDFIILESKSVEAIIEVKSTFSPNIFSQKKR